MFLLTFSTIFYLLVFSLYLRYLLGITHTQKRFTPNDKLFVYLICNTLNTGYFMSDNKPNGIGNAHIYKVNVDIGFLIKKTSNVVSCACCLVKSNCEKMKNFWENVYCLHKRAFLFITIALN
jgi:hypothetical protein